MNFKKRISNWLQGAGNSYEFNRRYSYRKLMARPTWPAYLDKVTASNSYVMVYTFGKSQVVAETLSMWGN